MPPYFYILALLTYLPISDLFAIKMVSSAVDIVLAIFAANLAADGRARLAPLAGGVLHRAVPSLRLFEFRRLGPV